jgi:hypothetical protein
VHLADGETTAAELLQTVSDTNAGANEPTPTL